MTAAEQLELAEKGKALVAAIAERKHVHLARDIPAPAAVWVSNAQMRALRAYGSAYVDPDGEWRPDADPERILGWPLRRYDESMPPPSQPGDVVIAW